ncbi:hypothetical protein ACTPOE_13440 [Castellaniella sp. WN]
MKFSKAIDDKGMLLISFNEKEISQIDLRDVLFLYKGKDDTRAHIPVFAEFSMSCFDPTGTAKPPEEITPTTLGTIASTMQEDEKQLFYQMLFAASKTARSAEDPGRFRQAMANEMAQKIYAVYRPKENVTSNPVLWQPCNTDKDDDINTLKFLNAGNFDCDTQFHAIGYATSELTGDTEFRMLHPLIYYMTNIHHPLSFKNEDCDAADFASTRLGTLSSCFDDYRTKTYEPYLDRKSQVDPLLNQIYSRHDGTLTIGEEANNGSITTRNKLTLVPSQPFQADPNNLA